MEVGELRIFRPEPLYDDEPDHGERANRVVQVRAKMYGGWVVIEFLNGSTMYANESELEPIPEGV